MKMTKHQWTLTDNCKVSHSIRGECVKLEYINIAGWARFYRQISL